MRSTIPANCSLTVELLKVLVFGVYKGRSQCFVTYGFVLAPHTYHDNHSTYDNTVRRNHRLDFDGLPKLHPKVDNHDKWKLLAF
ncbi:hypothetical protein Y032_0675g1426 [Ancylostoma ceylanicum]|uniref:Uncharacterized protein n=1 Tax=Ancylostoma ceylanicum TaxID=53326 RepID=A0A016WHP0_9BILA|nr:hypothetical protein Y032_0675g1426 [Ancylostoma ceylanicum]